jgi:hypothetical protein
VLDQRTDGRRRVVDLEQLIALVAAHEPRVRRRGAQRLGVEDGISSIARSLLSRRAIVAFRRSAYVASSESRTKASRRAARRP